MAGDRRSWCKVASNLDSHPKVRRAGRNGREVFLFALRRNAEPGNEAPGSVAMAELEPWYLADQLMMSEADAADGLARCEAAGLITREENRMWLVGWDEEWGRAPSTGSERTAKWRKKKDGRDDVTLGDVTVTEPTSTNVTRDECDAGEERRGEEIRGEEKREERESAPPPAAPPLTLVPAPTPEPLAPRKKRSPKPLACTEDERASIETVLAKLSEQSGVAWSFCDTHARLILARLRDGVTEWEMRIVVAYCASPKPAGGKGWKDDEHMAEYLRPSTLFGPEKIHEYLAPARAWYAKHVEGQQRRGAAS